MDVSRQIGHTAWLALTLVASVAAQLPPTIRYTTSSGSGHASPSVAAVWRTRAGASELHGVDLLILARGRPGWYRIDSSKRGPSVTSTAYTVLRTATRDIEVNIDLAKKLVRIGNLSVDLNEGNVIFVDKIDESSGPVVTDIISVEAQIPYVGGADILLPLLRTPEILAFLRCNAKVDGLSTLCNRLSQP